MVAVLEDEISCFLFETAFIRTAKEKFNTNLPLSKDVHDTHLKSTDADYFFPDALDISNNDKSQIMLGLHNIVKGLTNIVIGSSNSKARKLLFENQENGYHIYGMDILVRSNLQPVLIECNSMPGFQSKTDSTDFLSKLTFGWINETILEPLFKHPGKATQHARKHKTYIQI